MAAKGIIAVILLTGVTLAASEAPMDDLKSFPLLQEAGRFLFNNGTQTVTIGAATAATMLLAGLIVVLAAAVAVGVLVAREGVSRYGAPANYGVVSTIHRLLESAAAKYQ